MNNVKLKKIGTVESVDIVDCSIFSVPAKVDTGADSSSIWATGIKKNNNGVLDFRLFGVGSNLYNGKKISTKHFKLYRVKNSFGIEEVRYKVSLKIRLGSSEYEEKFTLSDRSRNTFPILLGKSLLTDRFVVDVSQVNVSSSYVKPKKKSVLVLTARVDKDLEGFYETVKEKLNAKGYGCDVVRFKDLVFTMINNNVRVYVNDEDISEYSIVYIKHYKTVFDQALAVAEYCRYNKVKVVDDEIAKTTLSMGKLSEMMRLSTHLVRIPDTIVISTSGIIKNIDFIEDNISYPLVLKDAYSDRGNNNYIVSNREELYNKIKTFKKQMLPIIQAFIPNNGFYRIVSLGYKEKMIIFRELSGHKDKYKIHLNKPFGGANARILELGSLSPVVINMLKKATKLLDREVAGVDLLQDKTNKKWYILEVNYNPAMTTGKYAIDKAMLLSEFFESHLNKVIL